MTRAYVVVAFLALGLALVGKSDYEEAARYEKIKREHRPVQAILAHPLSCPEEDERGRPLRATVADARHDRCYYGPTDKRTKQGAVQK